MKKVILAAVILFAAFNSYSQVKETSIEVRGVAKIEREVESYQVDFSIAEEYGGMESSKPFADLKKDFFAKAKAAGFEESRFKEDKMGFLALQYYREGSLFSFVTQNKEELFKVNKLANGTVVTIISSKVKLKPLKENDKLIEVAFRDSKEKAENIAKAINKKLGALLTITDYSPLDPESEGRFNYLPVVDQYYYITVKFSIE